MSRFRWSAAVVCWGLLGLTAGAVGPNISSPDAPPNPPTTPAPALPSPAAPAPVNSAPGTPTIIYVQVPASGASPQVVTPKRRGAFSRFAHQVYDHAFGPVHSCEPDGCPTPIGPSNPWTEFKWVFGSATQYFGTADATFGHLYKTTVPPPYRIPYPQQP